MPTAHTRLGMCPGSSNTPLENDMVVAARTGAVVHVPALRRPFKWIITKLAEYLINRKIPDLNSGFRIFRRDVAVRFRSLYPDGFSFTTTITLAMVTNNYRVKYVPINYHKRVGKSSIKAIPGLHELRDSHHPPLRLL